MLGVWAYWAACWGIGIFVAKRPMLVVVLPTMHISWGAGFIAGFLRNK